MRRRWKVLYAPRTLLKGFSPHEMHDDSLLGWLLPTIRASEFTVLQLVGLDATVLLGFFKMGFLFFLTASVLAGVALVPINWREHGTTEGVPPMMPPDDDGSLLFKKHGEHAPTYSTLYLSAHLVFTYAFTIIALLFLHRTYARFVHARQLFAIDHGHSIPSRTVLITRLPPHLRSERALAEYFEDMGLSVEAVSIARQVGELEDLIAQRTTALQILEAAWTKYLGNPVKLADGYDREREVRAILDVDADVSPNDSPRPPGAFENGDVAGQDADVEDHPLLLHQPFSLPGRRRPTIRVGGPPLPFCSRKVDALEHYATEFRRADDAVRERRRGRFRPTQVAFVTFETLSSAQIASQSVHYPQPNAMMTQLAPEPRDIMWSNLALSETSQAIRFVVVTVAMLLLLLFWGVPVSYLARLLSLDTINDTIPFIGRIVKQSPALQAFLQNSLPSLALVSFNAILPFFLEALCVLQGHKARSYIEYSLLKKYHLFLIINVLFIFVAVSTWALARDLADQPMKVIERLATSLPGARNFFVSYVMLQGLAIMPLQLVQLAVILPRLWSRIFFTRTPREHAELNLPQSINLGTVYPQAILIFIIGLTYSVIAPLVLVFATLYFGIGYVVLKYRLLFVFYRSYESRGQAWPITFVRIGFGLLIFQAFMLGLFILRQAFGLSTLMAPLIAGTVFSCWRMHTSFGKLAHYVNLSQANEMQRGQTTDVERLRRGHPVTRSQANLNRARYGAMNDEMYVVDPDERTDYSQPPMSSVNGILNTGRRRYAHPTLFGALPTPWLPVHRPGDDRDFGLNRTDAITLSLRRRFRDVAKRAADALPGFASPRRRADSPQNGGAHPAGDGEPTAQSISERLDSNLGVIALSDDESGDEEEDSPYRPFRPHPERRISARSAVTATT